MFEQLKRLGSLSLGIAWGALILLLPITSFPLLSRLTGGAMVAPASILPLGWLAVGWFGFYLIKKGTLPRESIPFLFFICIALIATAAAFFLNLPPAKGQGFLGEEISAVLTLAIGAGFYLVASGWLSRSSDRVRRTFQWIDIAGVILLLWSLVQAFCIFILHGNYPGILVKFQHLFSTQEFYTGRTTGFAFEPSWLAHQLNLAFLPFWLAASLTGWSAFRPRLWKFSLENILLAVGAVILFISSRVGTLSMLLVLAFLGIYFNVYLARKLQGWSSKRLAERPPVFQKIARVLLPASIAITFIAIYFLGATALVYGLSHVDPRLAVIFSFTELKSKLGNIYSILNYLQFAERYVYWVAGWRIFSLHPFLGVGLGNAGFFFQHTLPPFSWMLPEVTGNLYNSTALLNIKAFWVRLLAETGIAGFSAFIAWFIVMVKSSWALRRSVQPLFRTVGWAGLFVLIAFITEGFSLDTFALPYLWVSLGIVSAAAALVRKEGKTA